MKNKNVLFAAATVAACAEQALAAMPEAAQAAGAAAGDYRAVWLGFAAALTMTLSVLGSAYAVARIGSAAMGAAAEKPELLIRSLLFVALAEGLAVLGFVVAVMIIGKM
ncbi:MAG TPA: ATP synthase subunit C [Elusimicrobiales bacterium]|nr:ATP synthase subunit C [Elusimicrobiales bacterium]